MRAPTGPIADIRKQAHHHARLTTIAIASAAWIGSLAMSASCGAANPFAQRVTFNKHIAPIVFAHCVQCHRPGEAAPFSLLTYADAKEHAADMASETASHHMPPWLPERSDIAFIGERKLTPVQIDVIQRWAAEGAPEGEARDLPAAPVFPGGWQLGTPDLIVPFGQAYNVAVSANDVYRQFVLPLNVTVGKFVRAVDFRPQGAPIHHAVIRVDRTGSARRKDAATPEPGFEGMGGDADAADPGGQFIGWAPGRGPIESPAGMAWPLEEGADLVLEMHMIPQKVPSRAAPVVGLYFTDTPPSKSPVTVKLSSRTIDIAPGDNHFVLHDRMVLPVAVQVLSVYPHAHYLATDMRVTATLPDKTIKTLLHIPMWDFHWQQDYRFAAPINLPAGTAVSMDYVYDNSSGNAMNPSKPPVRVQGGARSVDEMGECSLLVLTESAAHTTQLLREFDLHERDVIVTAASARVAKEPNNAMYQAALGNILLRAGKPVDAMGPLEKALKLNPSIWGAESDLGSVLFRLGRTSEALPHLLRARSGEPTNELFHFNVGTALASVGRTREAEAAYRAALAINSRYTDALVNLGALFASTGRTGEAVPLFARVVGLEPESAESHSNYASALMSTRQYALATSEVERALAIDPAYAPALEVKRQLQPFVKK